MSAFLAKIYPDAIRLLTDGSSYNKDGLFETKICKVWAAKTVPLVVTGRGNWGTVETIGQWIADYADECGSADQAIILLDKTVARLEETAGIMVFDMLVCAWTESRGPMLVSFGSHSGSPDYPPFRVYNVGAEALGGPQLSPPEVMSFAKVLPSAPSFFELHGADLFEAMRRKPMTINPAGCGDLGDFCIGGHCQLTTLTRDGAFTQTLREWDDRAGEKIDPYAGSTNVTPLMSRKQRRALSSKTGRRA